MQDGLFLTFFNFHKKRKVNEHFITYNCIGIKKTFFVSVYSCTPEFIHATYIFYKNYIRALFPIRLLLFKCLFSIFFQYDKKKIVLINV